MFCYIKNYLRKKKKKKISAIESSEFWRPQAIKHAHFNQLFNYTWTQL